MVDFVVEMPDFQLRFQIDLIVMLRPQAILGLLAILAHHNDRGLNGSQARQNEIQQNERKGVEGSNFKMTELTRTQVTRKTPKQTRKVQLPPDCEEANGRYAINAVGFFLRD